MPALNFQQQFAPLVESGEKRQTIRAYRKDGRDPKVGDRLFLYTGMRTKQCRKLGEATAVAVVPILMEVNRLYRIGPRGGRIRIPDYKFRSIAWRDGFSDSVSMTRWFDETHALPFEGLLIRWGDIERPEPQSTEGE